MSSLNSDESGNKFNEPYVQIDSASNIICSTNPERMIATIGIRDSLVLYDENFLLISPLSQIWRIRRVIATSDLSLEQKNQARKSVRTAVQYIRQNLK